MPPPKKDLVGMFPSAEAVRAAFQREGPSWSYCPNWHALPHRTPFGRCTPLDCCDQGEPGTVLGASQTVAGYEGQKALVNVAPYQAEMDMLPRGMERLALNRNVQDAASAARVQAQAEEAIQMMRLVGLKAVREAIHPMPDLPAPPDLKTLGPRAYVKQRLEDVSPLMIERQIFKAVYNPGAAGDDAAKELLDRAGYRKSEGSQDFRGSVIIVNAGRETPYDAQFKLPKQIEGEVVAVNQPAAQGGDHGERSDGSIGGDSGSRGSDGDAGDGSGGSSGGSSRGSDGIGDVSSAE